MLTGKKKKVAYLIAFVLMVGIHTLIDKFPVSEGASNTEEIEKGRNQSYTYISKCISQISVDFAYVLTNDNQPDNMVFYKPECPVCKQVIGELK